MSACMLSYLIGCLGSTAIGGLIGWFWYKQNNESVDLITKSSAYLELNKKYKTANTNLQSLNKKMIDLEKERNEFKAKYTDFEPQMAAVTDDYSAIKLAFETLQAKYEHIASQKEKTIEIEKVIEMPVDVVKEVEKIVEVPVEVIKEVEVIKAIETIKEVEVLVEVIKEVEVEKIVEIEKIIKVPVELIREIGIEKIVEVPVEIIKEVEVEKIVEVPVEVIKEIEVIKAIETIKEIEIPVEIVKEVEVEKIVEVPVEVIKEVKVEVGRNVEVSKDLVLAALNNKSDGVEQVTIEKEVEEIEGLATKEDDTNELVNQLAAELEQEMQELDDELSEEGTAITGIKNADLKIVVKSANGRDDLKKIEGIGPKIEELLNNDGIYTFKKLATTSIGILRAILNDGGHRFRMHDPSTWPQQAQLVQEGNWTALQQLQEELKGGKAKE